MPRESRWSDITSFDRSGGQMSDIRQLLDRIQLLEQRVKVLEGAKVIDQNATILALQEMSRTIGMMMSQLLPIVDERNKVQAAIKEAVIERMFEAVIKTQKYPM